ncbi:enoyl-CoA hydratase-related protein [Sphaerotilus sp.]|uniref:enoyl-CoA hydratase-related protein n=1 Tax=Sphaerotilus sp. TaxID=2093942 RepID=UPI0025FED41F|nr:enoyl-CoA hydratase-related protein [Sphaerotilus sp.]
MSEPLLLQVREGAVLTLTLNRPAALNSFTTGLHRALFTALDDAAADTSVRCVVLTGAGRAFCSGQDLSDPVVAPDLTPGAPPKDLGHVIEHYYRPLVLRLRSMPVPVVAAVNGVAAGAGANLALACDLVLAGRSASFIQAFTKIGLVPDTAGTWLLPRLVGRAQALGLALLGDKLPAAEAERIGLIWRCVDDAALQADAQALAQKLAAMPTAALVATRQAMDAAQGMDLPQALDAECTLQRHFGAAHDYQEGVAAFMAKRAPSFTDR